MERMHEFAQIFAWLQHFVKFECWNSLQAINQIQVCRNAFVLRAFAEVLSTNYVELLKPT